ncbi:unnamed protein product [Oikopleura dioica]|uniref:Uncharacterized protein n=1 Tax=Oikopleura dioica TaxID=34765 RepID=E4WUQ7_OIKDI|nr:unnamed protein product [Oikopleura dioica]CBY32848.1 unnamed protein product [Oikopleura dioica]CBY37021.1 unnamed protein product [Oikopleura dioica]CBY37023.1 unnamed protein product [Oikopleura dioica]
MVPGDRLLPDLEDKKEECESTDSERMSIDTTEEVVLEESKPSSTLRKRKHVKIKEEKRKRATFLESSSDDSNESDLSGNSDDLFRSSPDPGDDESSNASCEDDFNVSFDEDYYQT